MHAVVAAVRARGETKKKEKEIGRIVVRNGLHNYANGSSPANGINLRSSVRGEDDASLDGFACFV